MDCDGEQARLSFNLDNDGDKASKPEPDTGILLHFVSRTHVGVAIPFGLNHNPSNNSQTFIKNHKP
jgi:hypothetical protein